MGGFLKPYLQKAYLDQIFRRLRSVRMYVAAALKMSKIKKVDNKKNERESGEYVWSRNRQKSGPGRRFWPGLT